MVSKYSRLIQLKIKLKMLFTRLLFWSTVQQRRQQL